MADATPVSSNEQRCPFCEGRISEGCRNEGDLRILTRLRLSVPVKCTMSGKGCNWEGELSQFWDHVAACDHFPRPCPYDCDKNVYMPRKILRAHLQDKCPMKDIACEYQWAGCDAVLNRREMATHMQEAAVHHSKLLAKAAKGYKSKITELQAEITQLKDSGSVPSSTAITPSASDVLPSPKRRKVTFSSNPDIINDSTTTTSTSTSTGTGGSTNSTLTLTLTTQLPSDQVQLGTPLPTLPVPHLTEATTQLSTINPIKRDLDPITSPIVDFAIQLEKSGKKCPPQICRYLKADRRTLMIMCQKCSNWFHSMCVKLPNNKIRHMTEFICPLCNPTLL